MLQADILEKIRMIGGQDGVEYLKDLLMHNSQ